MGSYSESRLDDAIDVTSRIETSVEYSDLSDGCRVVGS